MISLVINCDTRPGCDAEVSTTGDSGEGSLNGVRSWDFLTHGVINKLNFFSGHEIELILYIDEHEPIPGVIYDAIEATMALAHSHQIVCQTHARSHQRWNELIYLEALKLAHGDYVAHFDGDCAAFKRDEFDAGLFYQNLLGTGLKFICQPTTMSFLDHGMWWASTRFFFCKRETLDLAEIERCIRDEAYRVGKYGHTPALEHVLGAMAGPAGVVYPPADWNDYMIFSWSRYYRGLLSKLNAMSYDQVRDYILDCGIHGPNDVIAKPMLHICAREGCGQPVAGESGKSIGWAWTYCSATHAFQDQ